LGPVFRAYDAQRERLVAVKLFNLDLPPEKGHQLVAEFERLIAAELVHPALAVPLATGIRGVSAFLAQDYVAAESMDLLVREYGPADPADAVRVAAQLAGALDFAALKDISHGSLHPRDVLMSSDDTRLTGIGVARALEQVGVTAPVRRPYSAPERMAGGACDRRGDVFSLAALVHELLWGRRVSGTGKRAAESLTDIAGGDLARLRAAFSRALAEDPQERFDTALEFAEALKSAFPAITLARTDGRPSKKSRPATTELEPRLPLELPELDQPMPAAVAPVFDTNDWLETPEATPDLSLRAEDTARYEDVEVAPAIIEPDAPPSTGSERAWKNPRASVADERPATDDERPPTDDERPPTPAPAGLITGYEHEPVSVLEQSRSAVWPLLLALGLGIAMGFAGGYFTGLRERPAAGVAAAAQPAGREFTEGAVAEPLKPPSTPAPAPPTSRIGSQNPGTGNLKSEISNLKSQSAPGRLLVRSTPAGARVLVDGREYGLTPVAVRDLARGTHRVRVARDGYVAEERRVVLTRSHLAQSMTVPLVRARGPASRGTQASALASSTPGRAGGVGGALTIESRPAGAKVYLDGKLVGATPVSVAVVSAGEHAIRLERDGYRRWSSSVHIVASEQHRVTASLER
jgi:serine/threonine protein kinase